MSIIIEANYSKKIGLPHYSSHQYSVTIRSEISDLSEAETESARLYALLQTSVDREIQETGFTPGSESTVANGHRNGNTNGVSNGYHPTESNGVNRNGNGRSDYWQCSFKQRQLIERIIEENRLEGTEIEGLAQERFNLPVNQLNKLQASGLIEELFAKYSGKRYTPRQNGHATGNGYRSREYSNGGAR
jgi:hypothetical protein